jgi:dihydroorotate dehydrogenase
LHAAERLMAEKQDNGYAVDVIGCGGVLDGATALDFRRLGVVAMQYWSALVYRGPLAAALIAKEMQT